MAQNAAAGGVWHWPDQYLVYVAVRTTTATNAVILNSATPMMVLVLGSLYFRQKLARRQWAGMLVAMAGALLIVLKGNVLGMARCSSAGDLLVLAAGLCWAVYTLGLRTLLPGLDALVMMMVLLLVGKSCCCRHLCRKPGRLAVFTCCRCPPGLPCCIWAFSFGIGFPDV
jgi:drug/metabolite transporter (DMT)-like permease